MTQPEAAAPVEEPAQPELDIEEYTIAADQLRAQIEGALEESERMELSTEGLRGQIAQKWSTIHFYKNDGNIVRIKPYPHDRISSRTEEFYFADGQLILAVVEDDGSGDRGKEKESIDKIYYFHEGEVVNEMHNTEEEEYSIRKSDGERLLQEAAEYM